MNVFSLIVHKVLLSMVSQTTYNKFNLFLPKSYKIIALKFALFDTDFIVNINTFMIYVQEL